MVLYSGGLIIKALDIAYEIWGACFWEGLFLEGLGGAYYWNFTSSVLLGSKTKKNVEKKKWCLVELLDDI